MTNEEDIEVFAIVNRHDKIIGRTTSKDDLHSLKLLHRGVHVFVGTPDDRIVIQLKGKNSENPGKLSSSVSGHVRNGESYLKAAIRETSEELGIIVCENDLKVVNKIEPCGETGNEFVVLYTYLMTDTISSDNFKSEEAEKIIVAPVSHISEDIDENRGLYSPAFILLFKKWIELTNV